MDIRGTKTWCPDCTAPEVWHENLPAIERFLAALPAYRSGDGVLIEGFDRGQVEALFALSGVPQEELPEAWDQLADMEAELRSIRRAKARASRVRQTPS